MLCLTNVARSAWADFHMAASRLQKPATEARSDAANGGWLRPQAVVFTLLAEHLLERERAVFSGSFIQVLGRLGIGEHATRSTLSRMARRGLLARQRSGKKIYFRMTPRCRAILEDGRERIWHTGAVAIAPAGRWTLLSFSLPDAWQRRRYQLRVRLSWAGLGPLQSGLWLAPSEIDVGPILRELDLLDRVQVFHGEPAPEVDAASVIRRAFDLDALAEGYRVFLAQWGGRRARQEADPLSLTLRLSTQWLRTIHDDPRLPLALLPPDWPAIEAQAVFRNLHAAHRLASEAMARELLDTLPVE
jgi:phenylacetic acid degradation operon negative regulatory protein